MIKSVFLHAREDDAMDARLQVALDICRATGAHLTCLHVTPYDAYVIVDPFGGVATQGAILESVREAEAALRTRIETRLGHEDVQWDWTSTEGDVASTIVEASTLCDLIVISQHDAADKSLNKPLPMVDSVAVHAACGVLVVPKGVTQIRLGEEVVIGWNASPEAAHAIRAAIPILQMASFVHIASIDEGGADFPQTGANTYLSRHGIKSDLHSLPGSSRNAAQALHDFAVSKQASL